jgi:hypothetical protein
MRDQQSSILAFFAALIAACSGTSGPSDHAIEAYLSRTPGMAAGADGIVEAPVEVPPAKRVSVTIERAEGLPDLDEGPGETDPYVILEYEGQRHRSSVIEGSLAPVWGDTFILDVLPGGILTVKLMDEDSLSSDEQLGVVSKPLPSLKVGETTPFVLEFRGGEGGRLTLTLTGIVRP